MLPGSDQERPRARHDHLLSDDAGSEVGQVGDGLGPVEQRRAWHARRRPGDERGEPRRQHDDARATSFREDLREVERGKQALERLGDPLVVTARRRRDAAGDEVEGLQRLPLFAGEVTPQAPRGQLPSVEPHRDGHEVPLDVHPHQHFVGCLVEQVAESARVERRRLHLAALVRLAVPAREQVGDPLRFVCHRPRCPTQRRDHGGRPRGRPQRVEEHLSSGVIGARPLRIDDRNAGHLGLRRRLEATACFLARVPPCLVSFVRRDGRHLFESDREGGERAVPHLERASDGVGPAARVGEDTLHVSQGSGLFERQEGLHRTALVEVEVRGEDGVVLRLARRMVGDVVREGRRAPRHGFVHQLPQHPPRDVGLTGRLEGLDVETVVVGAEAATVDGAEVALRVLTPRRSERHARPRREEMRVRGDGGRRRLPQQRLQRADRGRQLSAAPTLHLQTGEREPEHRLQGEPLRRQCSGESDGVALRFVEKPDGAPVVPLRLVVAAALQVEVAQVVVVARRVAEADGARRLCRTTRLDVVRFGVREQATRLITVRMLREGAVHPAEGVVGQRMAQRRALARRRTEGALEQLTGVAEVLLAHAVGEVFVRLAEVVPADRRGGPFVAGLEKARSLHVEPVRVVMEAMPRQLVAALAQRLAPPPALGRVDLLVVGHLGLQGLHRAADCVGRTPARRW